MTRFPSNERGCVMAKTFLKLTRARMRKLQDGGKNIERKRQQLEQSLVPCLGDRPLSQISSFDVERYKKHRLSQAIKTRKKLQPGELHPPVRPSTVNRELATLSHMLNKA